MNQVYPYSVGIDVSKESLVVQVMQRCEAGSSPLGESTSWPNQHKGYRQLHGWLRKLGVSAPNSRVVMEATGMYWKRAAQFFYESGWEVWVMNPRRIHAYTRSLGCQGKTDPIDAGVIARYGHQGNGRAWIPDSQEIGELRSLIRHREDVIRLLGQLRNQKESWEADPQGTLEVLSSLQRLIRQVKEQRKQLDKAIHHRLHQTPAWQEIVSLLQTVPGIGDITLAWLLVETRDFQRFATVHSLASYAGVIPYCFRSGTSVKHKDHISNVCQHSLRSVLYMAGISAIRVNPLLKEFYLRLRQREKPFKVALIAVVHKLLRILFAMIQNKQPFDPSYHKSSMGGSTMLLLA